MIGKFKKSFLKGQGKDTQSEVENVARGKKKSKSEHEDQPEIKRAVEQPARRSVLGTILEESFSRVRDDIQAIRDTQHRQGEEVRNLADAMERLTEQLSKSSEPSQADEGLSEELKQVKERLDELQENHEMRFNTQLTELVNQIEGVKNDIDKHSKITISEDDIDEKFQALAEKDFALKEDVEEKLTDVTDDMAKLAKRIEDTQDNIKGHMEELKEAGPGTDSSESVNKLFEDLNELDNEIIDLKRELNKERKLGLDIRKDMDDLFSTVRELQDMRQNIMENAGQILDLQRVIGSDFKNKYY